MDIKPDLNLKMFTEELVEYGQSFGLDITFNPYNLDLLQIYGLTPAKKELLIETLDLILEELLASFDEIEDEEVDAVLTKLNTYINTIEGMNLNTSQLLH